MKAIILAGGSGTRLWPMSRKNYPKQFLKLNGSRSLLQQTVERLAGVVPPEDIVMMTNNEYKFHVKSDLSSLNGNRLSASSAQEPSPFRHIILEPACRNTAPAVALGVRYCVEKMGCSPGEAVCVLPSDHVIRPADVFGKYLAQAEKIAQDGHVVTFGIKPTRPETGYGYIKVRSQKSEVRSEENEYFHVEKFIEKPDIEAAKRYIETGEYYWNSGMFLFTIGTIMDEFRRHAPEMGVLFDVEYKELEQRFVEMPATSIDYAVMEKSDRMVTLPMDIFWSDVGSWDSLFDLLDRDENGNVKSGDIISVDTRDTLIIGNKRLITTVGLDDCLIVETDDAILITKRGQSQKVREVITQLEQSHRKEAAEHTTTFRPWGSYTVLEEGNRYKIKRIVVNPCERLSLQKHYHRSEHWIVVRGTAKVAIGDKEIYVHENESAYVPKSTFHRLENPGKIPLEMIEVQNGEYLGEDDIVRINDLYGREADKSQAQGETAKSLPAMPENK